MRRVLYSLATGAALLPAVIGCRATPGFAFKFEVTKPPVLTSPSPVTPVEAQPIQYAVEDVQPWAHYSRQPIRYGLRAPSMAALAIEGCPPCPPYPGAQPQMLPQKMPQGGASKAPADCPE